MFAIQEEISQVIVEALKVRLTAGGAGHRAAHRTNDPEAYAHYLRGRYFWNQRKEPALRNAIAPRFQRLLEKISLGDAAGADLAPDPGRA